MEGVRRELQTIRTEIISPRQETAALKRENFLLNTKRTQLPLPSRRTQLPHHKNVSQDELQDQPPQQLEARLGRLEYTLEEQKSEYTNLHRSALSIQAAW